MNIMSNFEPSQLSNSPAEPQKESYEPPRLLLLGSLEEQTRAGSTGLFDLSTFDS